MTQPNAGSLDGNGDVRKRAGTTNRSPFAMMMRVRSEQIGSGRSRNRCMVPRNSGLDKQKAR